MSNLFVGAGRSLMNPEQDMYPMPTGFGMADDIYDSCHCRAIAVKSGGEAFLLLVFELSDFPTVPGLIAGISGQTGIPEDNIFISYTHNHTSPCDRANLKYGRKPDDEATALKRERYKDIELAAALSAAKQAVETMRPARCGFGTIPSYVNVNRDYETLHGYWVEAPNYAGFSDKTLSVVKFVDEEGGLIAVLMNHGTHSTCAMNMRDTDHRSKLSGNFSGIACRFVEEHYGENTVAAWTAGAAGNQDPLMSHGLQYEYPDGYTSSVPYPDGTGYMQMEYLGRRHGADAVRCIDAIEEYTECAGIQHICKVIELPGQKRIKTNDGKFINPRMGGNGLRDETLYPRGTLPPIPDLDAIVAPAPEAPVAMHIHMLKIGQLVLVLTNGELYSELGYAVKEASPFKKTAVLTYSTAQSTDYIVDKSSVSHKVFQAFGPVAPGLSDELILSTVREMFASLR